MALPVEDKCLTAVFKEKEPKIEKARGYCKLTYDMRLFQVSSEKNIADALFPYVTHQSMTMTEQTLVNTICRLTAPFSHGDIRYLFLSLDFKRWCLKMSQRVLAPLFSELDRLFGFTYFSYLCILASLLFSHFHGRRSSVDSITIFPHLFYV